MKSNVHGHSPQPADEVNLTAIATHVMMDPEENLANDILQIVVPPRHGVGEPDDFVSVMSEELQRFRANIVRGRMNSGGRSMRLPVGLAYTRVIFRRRPHPPTALRAYRKRERCKAFFEVCQLLGEPRVAPAPRVGHRRRHRFAAVEFVSHE
jgi:hypothetical protein